MDLSWRTQHLTLRLSPNYRRTTDEIEYIRTVDANGVSTTIPHNLTTVTSWGGLVERLRTPRSGRQPLGHHRGELDAARRGQDCERLLRAWQLQLSQHQRQLSAGAWRERAGLHAALGSARDAAGPLRSSIYSDLGLRKNLWSENATLNVRLTDPFDVYRSSFRSRDPSFAASGSSRNSVGCAQHEREPDVPLRRMPQKKSTDTGDGPPMPGGPGG